jgi:hypothetical protein
LSLRDGWHRGSEYHSSSGQQGPVATTKQIARNAFRFLASEVWDFEYLQRGPQLQRWLVRCLTQCIDDPSLSWQSAKACLEGAERVSNWRLDASQRLLIMVGAEDGFSGEQQASAILTVAEN